jgi:hypothetical protein
VPVGGMLAIRFAAVWLVAATAAPPEAAVEATIASRHDGDTVHILVAGRGETVRLIGIDTPETSPNDRARDQARRMGISLEELLEPGRRARDFAARLAPRGTGVRGLLPSVTSWLPPCVLLSVHVFPHAHPIVLHDLHHLALNAIDVCGLHVGVHVD